MVNKEIALRITFFKDNEENINKFIEDYKTIDKVLASEEIGDTDNLHYHFYIEGDIKKLRNDLRQKYNIRNQINSDRFSCKIVRNKDKYISYICKDGDVIINNLGITKEQMEYFVEIHHHILTKEEKKVKKSSSFFQVLLSEYQPEEFHTKREIVDHIVSFLSKKFKGVKVYDDYIITKFVNGIGHAFYSRFFMDSIEFRWRIYDRVGIA